MVISLPNYVYAQKAPFVSGRMCLTVLRPDSWLFFLSCVILQKKAQTQQAREFHSKSIKEKAVHLSGLFSSDSSAELKVTISSLVCDATLALSFALPALHSVCVCVFICMCKHVMFGITSDACSQFSPSSFILYKMATLMAIS